MMGVAGPTGNYNPLQPTYINFLKNDLLRDIFARLGLDAQMVLPQVCRGWRALYDESATLKLILAKYDASYTHQPDIPTLSLKLRLNYLKKIEAALESTLIKRRIYLSDTRSIAAVQVKGNQIFLLERNSHITALNTVYKKVGDITFNALVIASMHLFERSLYFASEGGVIFLSHRRVTSKYSRVFTSPIDTPITHLKVQGKIIFYIHANDTSVRRYDQITRQILPPIGNRAQPIAAFEVGSNRLFIAYLPDRNDAPSQVDEWDLCSEEPKFNRPHKVSLSSFHRIKALCCVDNYLFVGEQTPAGRGYLRLIHILSRRNVFSRSFDYPVVGLVYKSLKLYVASPKECSVLLFPNHKTSAEKINNLP